MSDATKGKVPKNNQTLLITCNKRVDIYLVIGKERRTHLKNQLFHLQNIDRKIFLINEKLTDLLRLQSFVESIYDFLTMSICHFLTGAIIFLTLFVIFTTSFQNKNCNPKY